MYELDGSNHVDSISVLLDTTNNSPSRSITRSCDRQTRLQRKSRSAYSPFAWCLSVDHSEIFINVRSVLQRYEWVDQVDTAVCHAIDDTLRMMPLFSYGFAPDQIMCRELIAIREVHGDSRRVLREEEDEDSLARMCRKSLASSFKWCY